MNEGSASEVKIGLPQASALDAGEPADGMQTFRNQSDKTTFVVNPVSAGLQLAAVLGSPQSPTKFIFPIEGPDGSTLRLEDDNSARLVGADGATLAVIDTPWAFDAQGKEVRTRFEIDNDGELTQVVDHRAAGVTYPVTADPRIFACDLYTALCVKFTKSETKSIAKKAPGGGIPAAAFAIKLCGEIKNTIISAGCVAGVTGYAYAMGKSFKSAAKNGKCIEVHFGGAIPRSWKTESC